jgi:hypothetical protein
VRGSPRTRDVITGLVPVISIREVPRFSNRDDRHKAGHDAVDVIPICGRQRAAKLSKTNACDIRPLFLDVADTNVILER